ncbi:MAG: redoxin domain-containing protein, partial [Phycisphaeraceae bacterium]|nr:redoxin domain-containing protein [Phycisphaeraceae bacterium]
MRILSVVALLAVFASVAFAENPTHLGEKAPPFRFGAFANATVPFETLEELKGDVVLLCWLRTACPGCRAVMPILDKARKDFDRSDFHVFAATNDSLELFQRFLVHEGVGRKYDVPTAIRSRANWGVTKLPWAYVIGRDGKVAWAGHPGQGVSKAVKAALAKSDPAVPEAPRSFTKATSLLAGRRYAK